MRSASKRRLVLAGLLVAVSAWVGSVSRPAAAAPTGLRAELGVYEGSAAPGNVQTFSSWLGRSPRFVIDFLQRDTWEAIARPDWWAQGWSGHPYTVVYAVPLLPESGASSLEEGASGAYDATFRRLATVLVRHDQANAIIRLGWEFNGGWYSWSAYKQPGAFVKYWRRTVETMRSVKGARFRFEWSPVYGRSQIDAEEVYPGDAWVDLIGLSLFDASWYPGAIDPEQRWGHLLAYPFGLLWHRDFAAAHRKPMAYPEWGMISRPDGAGGGDNPYFIERMHAWLAANRSEILYHAYFDFANDAPLSLPEAVYPRGAARFRELFRKPFPTGAGDGVGQVLVGPIEGAPAVGVQIQPGRGTSSRTGRRIDVIVRATAPRGVRRALVRVDGKVACILTRAPLRCRTSVLPRGRHVVVASVTDREGWSGWGGTVVTVSAG